MNTDPSTLTTYGACLAHEDMALSAALDSTEAALRGGHITEAEARTMLITALDIWLRNIRLLRAAFKGER